MAANNKTEMKMDFCVRVATHSILKDINNGRQDNLVFSPLSLQTALNLLTAGAKGPTLNQLLRFLDLESITQLNDKSSLFMELATAESDSESTHKPLDETLSGSTHKPLDETPSESTDKPLQLFETPSGTKILIPSGSIQTFSVQNSGTPFNQDQLRPPLLFGPSPFNNDRFDASRALSLFNFKNQFLKDPNRGMGPYQFEQLPFSRSREIGLQTFNQDQISRSREIGPQTFNQDQISRSSPIISLLNGIWVDQRYTLKHSFKQLAEDVYKAKIESVDYLKANHVAEVINHWAREASKGHIDKIVSAASLQDSIFVLASALYFKGSWLQRFEARNTREDYFYLLNGERVKVPFMNRSRTYNSYRSFESFKLLKMEYEKGRDNKSYAMYIFLPDRYDGLKELVRKFHSDPRFFTQKHELYDVEINRLWLPKLKYNYELDVTDKVRELGLDLPFKENAELTNIVDQCNVYVSSVMQKSYIEVNEEGTVATSITTVTACFGCPSTPVCRPTINFVADHPFLFMIKEEISGIVLFIGAALNPLS